MFFLSDQPNTTEMVFLACAFGGTLFFLMRVLLVLVGGFGAEDFDSGDGDPDFDADAHDGEHSELAFKIVSLNSIAGFFMMFGWTGMSAYVEFQTGAAVAIVLALIVGFLTMVLTAYLFRLFRKLQSAGADFHLSSVVGMNAKVYQRIPATGNGKVQVSLNGMLREIEAESATGEEIDSFTTVTITSLNGTSGVVVEPAVAK